MGEAAHRSENTPPPSAPPVFTIGHSTRSIAEFVTLLRAGRVQLVVDIRRIPRSRTNPQYNADVLPAALAHYQINHTRIAELGGLRKASGIAPETNGFWTNQSFHHYADYALTDDFRRGFDRLLQVSAEQRTAIMCAEAVWWRCHRRIVADYLINAGRTVYHLMDTDQVQAATLSQGAVRAGDALIYPASADRA
ncbi:MULTISPECIES: DUF488 domain-containing protein [unclassified Bradyrhizobium]|uniref:DUF488 domain-containing protein n=1 Tax=unclassified Bradyrhizobium TaxID=2631580 RepID=UPI0028EEBCC7|nr:MULTISPECIES: DUF488 domain-containing protein [unclassified Bradyrhizobium]